MENLRIFNTQEEYEAWKDSDDYVFPNVCRIDGKMVYNNFPDPLWIEALEDITVWYGIRTYTADGRPYEQGTTASYSFDKVNWIPFTTDGDVIVRKGQKLYCKSTFIPSSYYSSNYRFHISGKFNAGGDILSLCLGDDYLGEYDSYPVDNPNGWQSPRIFYKCFGGLAIINAKELVFPPYTSGNVYSYMFEGCKDLITAPKLPALKLASECYMAMFNGCTSLTKAPTLAAQTSSNSSGGYYNYIFYRCSNLSYIKFLDLAAPHYTDNGTTGYWVSGVASTGKFIKNVNATWNGRGVHWIPEGWDVYLYDELKDMYVIRLKVNGIPYEMYTSEPIDVTWEEFINNDSYNGMFEFTESDDILYNGQLFYINGVKQSKSDLITIDGLYTTTVPVEPETASEQTE